MIHILTLSWNGLDKLKRLRPGLMDNLEKTDELFTWYIRDNGSKDGTAEEISKWDNVVSLIKDHNRDNFAHGVNSLINLAQSNKDDTFLLLNNDIIFQDSNSLLNMYKCFNYKDVSVVGARLKYIDSSKLQHAGVIFGPKYGNMPYHYRHGEESDDHAMKNRYFQAVTAAVCMVKASDIGELDTGFNFAFEDIDMCLRIGTRGKKIVYCGQTDIYHEESASLKKNPINKLFLNQNVQLFKQKWFGKYDLDHEKYLINQNYHEAENNL